MGFFNHDELGKRYKVNFSSDEEELHQLGQQFLKHSENIILLQTL